MILSEVLMKLLLIAKILFKCTKQKCFLFCAKTRHKLHWFVFWVILVNAFEAVKLILWFKLKPYK